MTQDGQADKLRDVAAHGMAFIALGQASKLVIHLAALAVMSRLLGPAEFGIFAMVSPLLALAAIVKDCGLTSAILQRQTINDRQLTALFWISICWGAAVAGLFALSAPVVAKLYAEPRLDALVLASSVIVLSGSLSIQHVALLNRGLHFRSLALIDAGSLAAGYLVGCGVALLTGSYWALWSVACTTSLTVAITSWVACRWRPSRPGRDARIGELVRIGRNVTLSSLFDFLIRSGDNVLIGRFRGGYELGLYDRSYRIVMLPLNFVGIPLERLVLPVLARVRADEARYNRIYRLALQAPLLAILPGLVAVMAAPEPVCLLLLGRDWIAAAPILAWLSLAASLQLVTNSLNPLLISQDRTGELTALNAASVVVAYGAYLVGLPYGALGVAAAYAISELVRAPIAVWWATRKGAVRTLDVGRTALPFAASAIVTLLIMSWLKRQLPAGPLAFLALSICIAYAATGLSLLCSRAGRECLREATRMVTKVVGPSIGATVGGWLRNHPASAR